MISTPGGAVILLFWSQIRALGGRRRREAQLGTSSLGILSQNRYFLHDYINKHTCTQGLLARSVFTIAPTSSGPCCSCFRGFQSVIQPDPLNKTLIHTHTHTLTERHSHSDTSSLPPCTLIKLFPVSMVTINDEQNAQNRSQQKVKPLIIFSHHAVHLCFTSFSSVAPTPRSFSDSKRPPHSVVLCCRSLHNAPLLSIYPHSHSPCSRGDSQRARLLSCIGISTALNTALICQLHVTRTSVMVTTDRKVNNNILARWWMMTRIGVSVWRYWCSHSVVHCGINEYIRVHIWTRGNSCSVVLLFWHVSALYSRFN